jgi:hypothetical protein
MTMNSWKSTLLAACAPPLMMFIIGTGSRFAIGAAEIAVERQPAVARGGARGGQRDGEDRVRAEPALVRRAVELDHRAVELHLVVGVHPLQRRARSPPPRCATASSTPLPR